MRPLMPDNGKTRVVIDGIALQTTAGHLRHGTISFVMVQAFVDFERAYKEGACGYASGYQWDGRTVNIQFDVIR